MKMMLSVVFIVATVFGAFTLAMTWAAQRKEEIAGITADHVQWFTPAYYKDGRQRAQLFGDSSQGGAWIGRVKIPAGMRLLARDRSLNRSI